MSENDLSPIEKQLNGYRLATAEIIYHLPDHPRILQSFVWQQFDLAPDYPELRRFIAFWTAKIDGQLHSVTVGHKNLCGPNDFAAADIVMTLH